MVTDPAAAFFVLRSNREVAAKAVTPAFFIASFLVIVSPFFSCVDFSFIFLIFYRILN